MTNDGAAAVRSGVAGDYVVGVGTGGGVASTDDISGKCIGGACGVENGELDVNAPVNATPVTVTRVGSASACPPRVS